MVSPERLQVAAAAEYLGVPTTTLSYWRAQRTGPRWFKLGKRVMYDRLDLDAFITQSRAVAS